MSFDLSILGVTQNIPKVNYLEYTGVFQAPPKFGKTTWASYYPKSILLAVEEGYKAQVVNKRSITTWDDLVDFIDKLEENREAIGDNVQSIIVDTVDKLYPLATPYVLRKQGILDKKRYTKVSDIPYGAGYGLIDQEFESQLNRILAMGFTILYLTHSKVKPIRPKDAEPYDVYESTMPDRCARIIYPACDFILHGERRVVDGVPKRVLLIRGNEQAVAGSRVAFEEDIVFDSEEEAMDMFKVYFRKGIEKNLRKAGVTRDIDEIAAEQEQERREKVAEYIESRNVDAIRSQLAELVKNPVVSQNKAEVIAQFKAIMGDADFNKVTVASKLEEAVKWLTDFLDSKGS